MGIILEVTTEKSFSKKPQCCRKMCFLHDISFMASLQSTQSEHLILNHKTVKYNLKVQSSKFKEIHQFKQIKMLNRYSSKAKPAPPSTPQKNYGGKNPPFILIYLSVPDFCCYIYCKLPIDTFIT